MNSDKPQSAGIQRLLEIVQGLCWVGLAVLPAVGIIYGTFAFDSDRQRITDSPLNRGADGSITGASPIRGLNVSSDGQYLDVVHADMTWNRHDAHTGRELKKRRVADHRLSRIAVGSPEGVSAGVLPAGFLAVFDEHEVIWQGELPDQQTDEAAMSCSVCSERNLVAAVSNRGSLWLLEFNGTQATLRSHTKLGYSLDYVELSPSGERVAMVTHDKRLLIWDTAQERLVLEHAPDITGCFTSWSGDGRRLMTFGWESQISVWQVDSGELVRQWKISSQIASAAKLSMDGRLAAVSEGFHIRLWDVETGIEHSVLQGHKDVISALQFADRDRTLFSGDLKGQLRRWSVTDQREVWAVP